MHTIQYYLIFYLKEYQTMTQKKCEFRSRCVHVQLTSADHVNRRKKKWMHKLNKEEKRGNIETTANNIRNELTLDVIIILVIIIIILIIVFFVFKNRLIRLPKKEERLNYYNQYEYMKYW